MTLRDTIQQETEFQRRKVAGLERYIAQHDLEIKRGKEMALYLEETKREFATKLKTERTYLEWLEQDAPVGDQPDEAIEPTE